MTIANESASRRSNNLRLLNTEPKQRIHSRVTDGWRGNMGFSFISHWGTHFQITSGLGKVRQGVFLSGLSFPIVKPSSGPIMGLL